MYLDAIEWSDDVHGGIVLLLLAALLLRLFRKLYQGASDALQLAHVLSAFANDASYL